jgi:ligand-binding sensor domain-containing protein/serine phosphatase RsbU (regulator of sigma subunit)
MAGKKVITVRAKLFAWLIFFSLYCINPLAGQKYFFDNYGIRQGLSEQKVYKLFQDSKDYIWLGTANGLSRFDGKTFKNFTSRGDSLSPGGVNTIIEDSLKYLWFGHNGGGVTRYNGQVFEKCAFDSLIVTGDITSIVQAGNKMWFTSATDGVILVDFPVKDIKHIRGKQFRGKERLSDQVFGSYLTKDGSYICIADVGLRKYNSEEKNFENYRMPHLTTYFNPTCVLEDRKGNMWFGTYNGGIYKYVMSESKMEIFDLPKNGVSSNWISCLAEDRFGSIWAGTFGGGIAVIQGDKIRKFDETNGLNALKIHDIIEDVEGNILIADQDNGLTIFKGDAFETIIEKEIIPDPNVNAVYQDATGAMWFAANSGISRYYPQSDKQTTFYKNRNNQEVSHIKFFRKDRDGNLWMGADSGGVILYDMKHSRFQRQPYINSTLPDRGQVNAMEIDGKNNLWIGTADGLAIGTINEQNFIRNTQIDSTTVNTITALYCDPNGNMWIGTDPKGKKPGLFTYDHSKKDFRREDFRQFAAFNGISPKTMVMDNSGTLWVGTSQGLHAFKNDSIIFTLTASDGLLSDNINLLAMGNDGNLFIGTNLGLNRYNPETKRIFSYTKKNGFTGIETKQNAVFKGPSGELWFGTANGVVRLLPDKIPSMELEPLTHILNMQVSYHNREMVPGLKLSYKDARFVMFDYYSICLTNPEVVRYRVKLEGADIEWQPVTDQTRAIYPALRPGKYTFNVIACNSQGVWNTKPATFHFIIRPPFYRTWWFLVTVFVAIVVSTIMYIKAREMNLRMEKIILEEKVEERTAEVVQKSMEIEEKNRDIMASIRYAERIQRAMLPRENTFQETFVLFMPKDIVSGDFYWMYDNGDIQFIAVADCTGHGVPGAFMSIIGHNSLNKIVREYGLTRPSAIMDQLNVEVMKALLQRHEKAITDGMDIALIAFNKRDFTLEFAGAFNPLYLARKGEVTVYRGDRFPIGMMTADEKKSFTNHTVDILPGDMLYMCSDGYADQFGTAEAKKYKSANVKKLLAGICHLPICTQKDRLEKEILDWKGSLEQVDDILFIGTKIP